jgi:hypothetical protein
MKLGLQGSNGGAAGPSDIVTLARVGAYLRNTERPNIALRIEFGGDPLGCDQKHLHPAVAGAEMLP